jgi:hypothetical protein
MIKKNAYPLFLILVAIWWAWTFLVDFFVVRLVFAHVEDFFTAGELGIALFRKLNSLEIIVASAVLALGVLRRSKLFIGLALCGWIISMSYFIYLIPKIAELTELWKAAEAAGVIHSGSIPDVQLEHQFFHRSYILVDSFKLLLLTSMLPLAIWKKESLS